MKIRLLIAILICNFSLSLWASNCSQEKLGFQEGLDYFHSDNFLLSSQMFAQVRIFGDEECGLAFDASYLQSASYLKLQDVKAFELSMQTLERYAKSPEQKDQSRLLRAYAYDLDQLTNVAPALQKRWSLWSHRKSLELSDLGSAELNHIHKDYIRAVHTKKPWLAGTLSAVLPGAGQAYNGSYQSAVLAFAFNALLLGTTLELNRRDLDLAAVTSGLLFSMTYLGNIASAVNGASQVNKAASSESEKMLQKSLLPELQF